MFKPSAAPDSVTPSKAATAAATPSATAAATPSAPSAAARSVSLPERWKRGRRYAALGSWGFLFLFTGLLHPQGGADRLDSEWLRARFAGREWIGNTFGTPKPDSRIALVEIDDKSVGSWISRDNWGNLTNELEFEWGQHIAQALNQLHRSGARLVALDWAQKNATDARMKWNHDQVLGQALHDMGNVVFVKGIGIDGRYTLPTPSLLYALPGAVEDGGQKYLGFADLVTSNGVQSALIPEIPPQKAGEKPEISFALRIARNSGWPLPAAPLREDGSLLINFANNSGKHGADSPFLRASLSDVAHQNKPDPRWKDKIVLIGVTYKGNDDSHTVPFAEGFAGSRLISGVEVQAHSVATLLGGNAIGEPSQKIVWLLSMLLGSFGVGAFSVWNWGRGVRAVLGLIGVWIALSFAAFCGVHFALPAVLPLSSLLLGSILMGGYRSVFEERQRAQVMKIWGRQQDPRIIAELLAHPEWRSGEGREMQVTVLFADLKNFTKTVELLSPAAAMEALNRYLALFSDTILRHGGVVDKYLGDGLMAQWGAPIARADHASAAVKACLDIQNRIAALTPQLERDGKVTFEARLTLHSGSVIAGPLGSEERVEYTIIGDTVNVTSRLQETAKALGCDFLISETTYAALANTSLDGQVRSGRETEVKIRGRLAPLHVFEILGEVAALPIYAA